MKSIVQSVVEVWLGKFYDAAVATLCEKRHSCDHQFRLLSVFTYSVTRFVQKCEVSGVLTVTRSQ